MNCKLFRRLCMVILCVPALAGAVTDDDFMAKTTQNLINLCTASADDPRAREAVHFCQGYLVGAFHYYVATHSQQGQQPLVCLPTAPPSRNEAFSMFVKWAQDHPQYMDESPVETEFRFLTETWPCTN